MFEIKKWGRIYRCKTAGDDVVAVWKQSKALDEIEGLIHRWKDL